MCVCVAIWYCYVLSFLLLSKTIRDRANFHCNDGHYCCHWVQSLEFRVLDVFMICIPCVVILACTIAVILAVILGPPIRPPHLESVEGNNGKNQEVLLVQSILII